LSEVSVAIGSARADLSVCNDHHRNGVAQTGHKDRRLCLRALQLPTGEAIPMKEQIENLIKDTLSSAERDGDRLMVTFDKKALAEAIENLLTTSQTTPVRAPRHSNELASATPWRIDRDNEDGIEIAAADNDLVHILNYRDIPPEIAPEYRAKIIAKARANFYLTVQAVNDHADSVRAGNWGRT